MGSQVHAGFPEELVLFVDSEAFYEGDRLDGVGHDYFAKEEPGEACASTNLIEFDLMDELMKEQGFKPGRVLCVSHI